MLTDESWLGIQSRFLRQSSPGYFSSPTTGGGGSRYLYGSGASTIECVRACVRVCSHACVHACGWTSGRAGMGICYYKY